MIPPIDRTWDNAESYLKPLEALVRRFQPRSGLEVGFGHWGFSAHIFLALCDGKLTSIDKGDWKGKAKELSEATDRFTFMLGRSEAILPTLKQEYDYVFIDGDHSYAGALRDTMYAKELVVPDGVIAFDDCYVPFLSSIDLSDDGSPIDGYFGVGQAVSEAMDDPRFEEVILDEPLANGGRVFARR